MSAASVIPEPKSMTRAKKWSDEVEEAYRFQVAGYKGEAEYIALKGLEVERWPDSGYIKKLTRKDGNFYYYNKDRECPDKDVHQIKIYSYN
ncbi:meiosis expressed gene 1 protein homolog [Apostichopus japonicus]|uniref:meiosis expressed gene 1 protein homolog n=1 Tax=Stichopus japonicus TaxID=307972 RepID=UPI003AB54BCF